MKLYEGSEKSKNKHNPVIYRERVHCGLRWVDDKVAQGEPKPLGSSPQKHSFRSRPWELLFRWVLHWRRASRASPFWGVILRKREKWRKAITIKQSYFYRDHVGFECPGYYHYPGFDRIRDMMLTCTQRNLVIHIPVCMISNILICTGACDVYFLQQKLQQIRNRR